MLATLSSPESAARISSARSVRTTPQAARVRRQERAILPSLDTMLPLVPIFDRHNGSRPVIVGLYYYGL